MPFGKMNKVLTIGLVGLGVYALTGMNKARAAQKLQFGVSNVDFSHMSLSNWTFKVILSVINPTKVEQNINAIFGSVYAGTRKIANIQQTTPQKITKQGNSYLEIPVKLTPDGAGYFLAQFVNGDIPTITVKGTVDTMGIQIPFEEALNG
ncbi:hypothetical protein CCP1ISM_250011 [Azospirillaceae bacterium]